MHSVTQFCRKFRYEFPEKRLVDKTPIVENFGTNLH